MITPVLLILASATLVAQDRPWERVAATPDMLRGWLDRHEARAQCRVVDRAPLTSWLNELRMTASQQMR